MDTNCARIKRDGIKQTAATKIRSMNFGIASRAAKPLRQGLNPALPFPTDRSMQSRFSGAIAKWLCLSDVGELAHNDEAPYISGFQFANEDTFNNRFKVPVTVSQPQDNLITVSVNPFVPVSNVAAPAGTMLIELAISVAGRRLADGMSTGSKTQRIQVPYNPNEIAAQVLQFDTPTEPESLIVTAAWLWYDVLKNNRISRSENPDFLPAGVINARYC